MATSHSVWGNCPAHKKNQLAMYPGVWCILTSVFSVISVGGMWQWVGWEYELHIRRSPTDTIPSSEVVFFAAMLLRNLQHARSDLNTVRKRKSRRV